MLFFLCLAAIGLSVYPKSVPGWLGFTFIAGLVQGEFIGKQRWSELPVWLKLSLFFPILFVLSYLLGMIHTQHVDEGWKDLFRKITLVLVPTFLILKGMSRRNVSIVTSCFLAGLLGSMLVNNVMSSMSYMDEPTFKAFLGENAVTQMHLGYYALYLIVGIGFILDRVLNDGGNSIKRKVLYSLFILYILVNLILTGSKMGFLTLIILIGIGAILLVLKGMSWKRVLMMILGFTAALTILVTQTDYLSMRLSRLTIDEPLDPKSVESTQARRMTWDCSADVFEDNLWNGVGTGDVKEDLMACYQVKGYEGPMSKELGPHSQYLETGMSIGLLGLLLLVFMFIWPLLQAFSMNHFLASLFFLSFTLACATESMLERAAGIHLYSIMLPLALYSMLWDKYDKVDAQKGNEY